MKKDSLESEVVNLRPKEIEEWLQRQEGTLMVPNTEISRLSWKKEK